MKKTKKKTGFDYKKWSKETKHNEELREENKLIGRKKYD